MNDRIDRTSPVPLYHQIAEALRNAIAVGELTAHDRLPPVRSAAREWGVNLHTVRRAYRELAEEGLVRVRGAHGTEVAARQGGSAPGADLEAFLGSWLGAARAQFGLTRIQVGQLLLKHAAAGSRPTVHVLECSREQAEGHARELMGAWRVAARPLVLAEVADLPGGLLIGTYFHYNDIRQRWPHRLDEVRFVAIGPDEAIVNRLPVRGRAAGRQRLLVCELEESKAMNIAADLRNVFSAEQYRIEPRVLAASGKLPGVRRGDVLLVSPRVWGGLPDRQRTRVVPIRYCIRAHELEMLGLDLGWERATTEATA
jgi:DNA-binding transcriptional regulator YhcF (GntR family)